MKNMIICIMVAITAYWFAGKLEKTFKGNLLKSTGNANHYKLSFFKSYLSDATAFMKIRWPYLRKVRCLMKEMLEVTWGLAFVVGFILGICEKDWPVIIAGLVFIVYLLLFYWVAIEWIKENERAVQKRRKALEKRNAAR